MTTKMFECEFEIVEIENRDRGPSFLLTSMIDEFIGFEEGPMITHEVVPDKAKHPGARITVRGTAFASIEDIDKLDHFPSVFPFRVKISRFNPQFDVKLYDPLNPGERLGQTILEESVVPDSRSEREDRFWLLLSFAYDEEETKYHRGWDEDDLHEWREKKQSFYEDSPSLWFSEIQPQ